LNGVTESVRAPAGIPLTTVAETTHIVNPDDVGVQLVHASKYVDPRHSEIVSGLAASGVSARVVPGLLERLSAETREMAA
jgi:hypothetical protein